MNSSVLTLAFVCFTFLFGNLSPASGGRLPKGLVYAPLPDYPYPARRDGLTGSGIVQLEVNKTTGHVISARMAQSTGHQILDDAALRAARQWIFEPAVVSKAKGVKIPILYTMRGSSF